MNKRDTNRIDRLKGQLNYDAFLFDDCMFGFTLKNGDYTIRVYEKKRRTSVIMGKVK